jgi:iron complex outermembrane receptor protein
MKMHKISKMKRAVGSAAVCGSVMVLGSVAMLAGSQQATAQQLEEIVVTSERRETNLQDTPISVISFNSEQLESAVVRDLFDISAAVPNLNINPGRGSGPAAPGFNIRGVGNGGVALYIDGIYFPSTSRSALRTSDLESLEVLRGPQGTLFGRNSTGGAVRVFTRKPTDTFEGDVSVQLGNYNQADFEGRVNIPLSDNVFVKGELSRLTRDGYVERFGVSGDQSELGNVDDTIGSLALRWIPNERVTVDLKARFEESDRNPVVRNLEELEVSNQGLFFHYRELNRQLVATGQSELVDNDPRIVRDDYTNSGFCFLFDNDPTSFESACDTGYESENNQFTGNVEWDINENHTFTFSGGYQEVTVSQRIDWLTVGAEIRTQDYDSEAVMLEGLLNSVLLDGNLDLVSGINYYSEESDEFSSVLRNNSTNEMADTRDIYGDTFDRDALGIFSQGVYHFPNGQSNMTRGLRYTSEDTGAILREWESGDFNISGWKECSTASSVGGGGIVVRDPNCMVTIPGAESYSEVDWKFGFDHDVNDNLMVFASASKAYRAGAFSHTASPTIDPSNISIAATDAEKVVNLEAGIRSEWNDNRFRLNFTYFDMDFTDRQGPRLVASGDSAQVIIVNRGDVDISGWELDGNLAVTDNLSVFASFGFTDARLANPSPPGDVNLGGIPEFSYNLGGNYSTQLGGGELSINLNYTWQDERHSTAGIGREDTHIQSSFGLLNGNIQYVFGDDREWTAALSGSNLTDESYGLAELRFGRFFMGSPRGTANFMQLADRGAPRMIFGKISRAF